MALRQNRKRGMSLLELTIASSMMALVMATVLVVLRTGRQAWDSHEDDYVRVEAAHATLRHVVRQIRQADGVLDITEAAGASQLSLRMPADDVDPVTCVWLHTHATQEVAYDRYVGAVGTPTALLAPAITDLRFTGFRADADQGDPVADGDEDQIQVLRVEVDIALPRDPEPAVTRTVSSWAWIRSW